MIHFLLFCTVFPVCRMSLFVAGFLICVGVAGCSGPPSDPVSDYKRFINGEFEQMNKKFPAIVLDGEYKLNVSKTDSLVSPLIGTISVNVTLPHKNPIKNPDGEMRYSGTFEMTHALQDDKWVMTTGKFTVKQAKVIKDMSSSQYRYGMAKDIIGDQFDYKTLEEFGTSFNTK